MKFLTLLPAFLVAGTAYAAPRLEMLAPPVNNPNNSLLTLKWVLDPGDNGMGGDVYQVFVRKFYDSTSCTVQEPFDAFQPLGSFTPTLDGNAFGVTFDLGNVNYYLDDLLRFYIRRDPLVGSSQFSNGLNWYPECVCEGGPDLDFDGVFECTDGPWDADMVDFPGPASAMDNCPWIYNPAQTNSDLDPFGNQCDNCIDKYNPRQCDSNGDGYGNACDQDLVGISGVVNASDYQEFQIQWADGGPPCTMDADFDDVWRPSASIGEGESFPEDFVNAWDYSNTVGQGFAENFGFDLSGESGRACRSQQSINACTPADGMFSHRDDLPRCEGSPCPF